MIVVFKTNVSTRESANFLLKKLSAAYPRGIISFDLDDCDKILRVETGTTRTKIERIINILTGHGFMCENLPISF
jgi:hypothetical protein